jgi:cbb3-type cytochrome oxidase cytochrome c subunit
MKGLLPLFLGIFGTFMFSWVGLTVVPNAQIGHLDPQSDEEGTDVYPLPPSGMAERGRHVYNANGCVYCHSRWLRPDYAGADIERKWGDRRSAPRDYIFDRPVLLGKMRTGPDLSNIGKRAPSEEENAAAASTSPSAAASPAAAAPAAAAATAGSASSSPASSPAAPAHSPAAATASSSPAAAATVSPAAQAATSTSSLGSENQPNEVPMYSTAWHHRHLYSPRSVTPESIMPAYRFLYDKRPISGQPSADALKLTGKDAPSEGWEIVPTYDAQCLVAFLLSQNQSHPLKEAMPGSVAQAAPAASASPAAAASPAK